MFNEVKNGIKRVRLNSSRVYLEQFLAEAGKSVKPTQRVLDAGAGDCKYRSYFDHAIYESADFCQMDSMIYGKITYECDLASIPVEDERFDIVICTQVIEHVRNPLEVIKELYRVLKPGGRLYLTTPLFYAEHHAPYDYYRYTQYGLRYLVEEAGFIVQIVERLEGYFGVLSYQLERAAIELPVKPNRYGNKWWSYFAIPIVLLVKPMFFILSLLFARLDVSFKITDTGMCKNYALIAVKREIKSI